jgi:Fic family protein
MIEQLKTNVLKDDDFQYIEDWDTYYIELQNYNDKIRDEALKEARELMRGEREQAQREREQAQREREQAQREHEQAVNQAKKETALQEKKHIVRNMRLKGYSAEAISDIADIPLSQVTAFFKELDEGK